MDSTNAYIFAGSGTPAEQVNLSTGTIVYLVADSLGSVRGAVASSGSLSGSVDYDAWGNPETAGGLSSYTPFGFAGAYTDLSGMVYLIGRYYDPQTGQFLSVDPDAEETQQPYAYGNDNPVTVVDPAGDFGTLQKCPPGVQTKPRSSKWSCAAAIFPTAGKEVLIRQGYWDKSAQIGFGRSKIVQAHNVYMQTAANVVAEIPPNEIKPQGNDDVYQTCQGVDEQPLPNGICVRVVVRTTDYFQGEHTPDGHELGVLTAYCIFGNANYNKKTDPKTICPNWINSAAGP